MTTREELRRDGKALRLKLFGPDAGPELAPGLNDLRAELAFGAVWARPGLALEDRMVAALAALCAVQRHNHLRRHVGAALDLGLDARAIAEIFVQCGIYAGLPATEDALATAQAVFAERGIELPADPPPRDELDELDRQGRALLERLHGNRGYDGYAAPDNTATQALYPVAIQYGYGAIWHRPGLEFRQRALVAVAAFTALRLVGQVQKFGQSALNAGLTREEIVETVIQTGPYSGLAPALNALAALSEALRG
ncbi:MAG TPA: carboxymuconolactone decarboxylase family protein [Stellaceae bacterium]|nr:carboxymuconolactone decarboxylase family protein [Stellaceae bacterium]